MRNKIKNSKNKFIKILIIVIIVLLIVLIVSYYLIRPILIKIAITKVAAKSTAAVNNAVFYALTEKTDYDDLIDIFNDAEGNITMLRANSVNINKLAREVSRESQESINKIGEQGIDIPIGSLSGSALFIGSGTKMHIKLLPVGIVNSDFYSEFESCGINQTRHKLYVSVVADIDMILPLNAVPITTKTDVLICENILIGSVPNTYLSMNGEGKFNLIE